MIPTHKISISVKYRGGLKEKSYYFNKHPNNAQKMDAVASFNEENKRYPGDEMHIVISECKLKPLKNVNNKESNRTD
jgi:hypothetical protein